MNRKHLSMEEREVIMIQLHLGYSLRHIAAQLGRTPSTVSRELRRNGAAGGYRAHRAHGQAMARRSRPRRERLMSNGRLRRYVDGKLRAYWSPEQISQRLKIDSPDDPSMRICYETIYRFILTEAGNGVDYGPYLRQGHRRNSYGWRGKSRFRRIRGRRRIEERPAEVEGRERLGDWESDSVRGCAKSPVGIATHVERSTRYLVAARLADRKADTYNQATIKAFGEQPLLPIHTMTVDNGMEFSKFSWLEKRLGTTLYFATPYHAWERGSNENTNGLLRQFFPKGTDFSGVHPRELQQAVRLLNNRPRKCLGYRTPAETMREQLVALRD